MAVVTEACFVGSARPDRRDRSKSCPRAPDKPSRPWTCSPEQETPAGFGARGAAVGPGQHRRSVASTLSAEVASNCGSRLACVLWSASKCQLSRVPAPAPAAILQAVDHGRHRQLEELGHVRGGHHFTTGQAGERRRKRRGLTRVDLWLCMPYTIARRLGCLNDILGRRQGRPGTAGDISRRFGHPGDPLRTSCAGARMAADPAPGPPQTDRWEPSRTSSIVAPATHQSRALRALSLATYGGSVTGALPGAFYKRRPRRA